MHMQAALKSFVCGAHGRSNTSWQSSCTVATAAVLQQSSDQGCSRASVLKQGCHPHQCCSALTFAPGSSLSCMLATHYSINNLVPVGPVACSSMCSEASRRDQ
jgi:hypothetical protein